MQKIKEPVWETGNIVVMDSGFCMLKGLIGMFDRIIYCSEFMKKRRYRPTGIYGDITNTHCEKRNRQT